MKDGIWLKKKKKKNKRTKCGKDSVWRGAVSAVGGEEERMKKMKWREVFILKVVVDGELKFKMKSNQSNKREIKVLIRF